MGPVLATEGELRQTATNTAADSVSRLMVRGQVAVNDGKRTNDGVF